MNQSALKGERHVSVRAGDGVVRRNDCVGESQTARDGTRA